MKYSPEKGEIILNKKINVLDRFVIDFVSLLDRYVLVSGYVSILFGRSRATEDVDLLIPEMEIHEFAILWKKIYAHGFECLNSSIMEEAFSMLPEHAIRFARKGKPIPNMEFKTIKNDIHKYSFEKKIKVVIGASELFISPIEMQIAFKLSLGSEKDLEDAKHLYEVFSESINKKELLSLIDKLQVRKQFEKIK